MKKMKNLLEKASQVLAGVLSSSPSQILAGIFAGTLIGFIGRPSIVKWMGVKLFNNLTTSTGLIVVAVIVGVSIYIALVAYTAFLKRSGVLLAGDQGGQR